MNKLLCYGEVLVDFIPADTEASLYRPMAGGAPANVAVAFAKLGGESYFAGGLSEDNFGQFLRTSLVNEGVNLDYAVTVAKANTAVVLVTLDKDGERYFNFYRENTADCQYSEADSENIDWPGLSIFHFCSNTLTTKAMHDNTLAGLELAKKNKLLVSFDVNLRQQLWQNVSELPARVEQCLMVSDLVKLSKDEALYLAEKNKMSYQEYLTYLVALGIKLVLITDGANQIQMLCSHYCEFSTVPSITAVDTTAAGDSFLAGFLWHFSQNVEKHELEYGLQHAEKVKQAVQFASQCGAFTCQQKGAFAALPTLSDLD